jgi:hypothetical protein
MPESILLAYLSSSSLLLMILQQPEEAKNKALPEESLQQQQPQQPLLVTKPKSRTLIKDLQALATSQQLLQSPFINSCGGTARDKLHHPLLFVSLQKDLSPNTADILSIKFDHVCHHLESCLKAAEHSGDGRVTAIVDAQHSKFNFETISDCKTYFSRLLLEYPDCLALVLVMNWDPVDRVTFRALSNMLPKETQDKFRFFKPQELADLTQQFVSQEALKLVQLQ